MVIFFTTIQISERIFGIQSKKMNEFLEYNPKSLFVSKKSTTFAAKIQNDTRPCFKESYNQLFLINALNRKLSSYSAQDK